MKLYNVENMQISNFKDLGVIFDSKFNVSNHSENMITNNTLSKLRTCSFNDPIALKTFDCSLVRSHLEHCLIIWINDTFKRNKTIKSYKIIIGICFNLFKFNVLRLIRGYTNSVMNLLDLFPLNDRRSLLLSKCSHKLILSTIDCFIFIVYFYNYSINTEDP